jgi:hypothetical protein
MFHNGPAFAADDIDFNVLFKFILANFYNVTIEAINFKDQGPML